MSKERLGIKTVCINVTVIVNSTVGFRPIHYTLYIILL